MANRRNIRRRHAAVDRFPDTAQELDLERDFRANGSARELKELLASSDFDGVRLDKLARAQQLAADPDYPPPEVIESVAELLAKHLQRD